MEAFLWKYAVTIGSILIISIIASKIRKYAVKVYTLTLGIKTATFIDTKLTFIGVIHHELSHMLVALLTGAKVKNVRLFKFKGDKLGEVIIVPRGITTIKALQLTLSAFAPVICGWITLYILYYFIIHNNYNITLSIIIALISMSISYHMSLSKQDIKATKGGRVITLILLGIVIYFIPIDYELYFEYLKVLLAIMCINLCIPLILNLIRVIRR